MVVADPPTTTIYGVSRHVGVRVRVRVSPTVGWEMIYDLRMKRGRRVEGEGQNHDEFSVTRLDRVPRGLR